MPRLYSLIFIIGLLISTTVSATNEDSLNIYLQKAGTAYTRNDMKSSIENYQNALRLDPKNLIALKNQAVNYVTREEYDKALELLDKARKVDSTDGEIYNTIGVIYASMGDTTRAINGYKRALAFQPDRVVAAKNLGSLLIGINRLKDAIVSLQQALKYDTTDADLYFMMGNAHLGTGDVGTSETYLDRAVAMQPGSAQFLYLQGIVKDKLGKQYEAESAYKKVIEIEPNHFDARQHLGVIYIMTGKYPEALAQFEEAVRIKPESDEARIALGAAYMYNDMAQKAKDVYDYLQSKNPEAAKRMMDLINPEQK